MNQSAPSLRAEIITRRTYHRPLNPEGTKFETWIQVNGRVRSHQRWLWERQLGHALHAEQEKELNRLLSLVVNRQALLAGRTMWLGGTETAKRREASQFNCAFLRVETIHDFVDLYWLLLQGCGVGFEPFSGTLSGFTQPIDRVEIIRSNRKDKGPEHNEETWDAETGTWTIRVGDSAEGWAKALGKLLAGKYRAKLLVLDFSRVRPAGLRLAGYGWLSNGDSAVSSAFEQMAAILNRRAGELLSRIDILDIANLAGTTLSSRRAAELALLPYGGPEWEAFASAKRDYYLMAPWRRQSNNTLLFKEKPSPERLAALLYQMVEDGGSEPGIANYHTSVARAPWFSGYNPCVEVLLPNHGFCNLVELAISKFESLREAEEAIYLLARANYRQTLVNLDDGILQRVWHETNEFLRLCGVSITGIMDCPWFTSYAAKRLRMAAHRGADSMADELGLPRAKNITTIKPSGTAAKCMDTTEGIHSPRARYIFNNIVFSSHDPIVPHLKAANYHVRPNPYQPEDEELVTFPVHWKKGDPEGRYPSAIEQLNRYKMVMQYYVDQNCSITVEYEEDEIDGIVQWLSNNWDEYVAVSFSPRKDTGEHLYLPQEVVTKEEYDSYVSQLLPVDLEGTDSLDTLDVEECEGGVCPVR